MRLRKLYHSGDENIPALYLIEFPGEKAFFNKFEGIKNYLFYMKSFSILVPFRVYPWEEEIPNLGYEN